MRWLFVGGLVVNAVVLTGIALRLGHARGYLFEIAVISVDWLVLSAAAFMLAVVFRRDVLRLRDGAD